MEPERLVDDPETPPDLSALLRRAPAARALEGETRARVRQRVAAAIGIPVGLSAVLSASSVSAAIGAATGVAVGAVTIGVFVVGSEIADTRFSSPAPSVAPPRVAAARAPSAVRRASEAPVRRLEGPVPVASVVQSTRDRVHPRLRGATANAPQGLHEESLVLEAARSALGSEPARALELAREHRRRFAQPRLAPERSLIEIEALYRLGRRVEGRALAREWLASGAGTLYERRVERLLESHADETAPESSE